MVSYAPTPAGTGDANNDGIVNGQDIALIASHWLHIGSNVGGDVNGDGIVNGQDIAVIASHWLDTYGSGAGGGSAVPEPSSIALLAIGAIGLAAIRHARAGEGSTHPTTCASIPANRPPPLAASETA